MGRVCAQPPLHPQSDGSDLKEVFPPELGLIPPCRLLRMPILRHAQYRPADLS
ncbi:hypothetical protein ACS15_2846 [Ralstonia insidiosa]|uniref:Uncharacterized protein n=1 Tax=Ralstonia insidiosa TaxID=190721 RepID=A0AAC9BII2_9RALS|nr:hypothetical protein ACS15_2846 [Ralstonia insidiosa]